jgi:hypothetical protein
MSKKDYIKIAGVLRACGALEWAKCTDGRAALKTCALTFAGVLADDNPRFDKLRFLAACGMDNLEVR